MHAGYCGEISNQSLNRVYKLSSSTNLRFQTVLWRLTKFANYSCLNVSKCLYLMISKRLLQTDWSSSANRASFKKAMPFTNHNFVSLMQFKHVEPCEGYRTDHGSHAFPVTALRRILRRSNFSHLLHCYYKTASTSLFITTLRNSAFTEDGTKYANSLGKDRSDNLIRIYGGGGWEWSVPSF